MENKNFKLPKALAEAMLQHLLLAHFSENNKKIPEIIEKEAISMVEPFKDCDYVDFRELDLNKAVENIKKEAIKLIKEIKL